MVCHLPGQGSQQLKADTLSQCGGPESPLLDIRPCSPPPPHPYASCSPPPPSRPQGLTHTYTDCRGQKGPQKVIQVIPVFGHAYPSRAQGCSFLCILSLLEHPLILGT